MNNSFQPRSIQAFGVFGKSKEQCHDALIWSTNGINAFGVPIYSSRSRSKHCLNHIEDLIEQKTRSIGHALAHGLIVLKICAGSANVEISLPLELFSHLSRNQIDVFVEVWKSVQYLESSGIDHDQLFHEQEAALDVALYTGLWIQDLDLNPSEITRILELEPTESFMKGVVAENGVVRTFSSWNLSTELDEVTLVEGARKLGGDPRSLNTHLAYLLKKLANRRTAFRKVRQLASNIAISAYWQSDFYVTQTSIDWEVARDLASYRIPVDLDIYI